MLNRERSYPILIIQAAVNLSFLPVMQQCSTPILPYIIPIMVILSQMITDPFNVKGVYVHQNTNMPIALLSDWICDDDFIAQNILKRCYTTYDSLLESVPKNQNDVTV